MLLEFPDEIQEDSEETMQLLNVMFAKANQAVEGHGVEKEPALPPVDALEDPTENGANSAKAVDRLDGTCSRILFSIRSIKEYPAVLPTKRKEWSVSIPTHSFNGSKAQARALAHRCSW